MSEIAPMQVKPQAQPDWVYDRLAEVYDLIGMDRFSRLAFDRCRDFLADSGLAVHRLLDLACGTGHFAIAASKLGVDVVGIDGSRAMLTKARRNSGRKRNSPQWKHGHLTRFSAPGRFDLITCWFDSLNHLMSDEDLIRCFRCARRHLSSGGALIFDVNTPTAFRERWGGSTYRTTDRYVLHEQGVTDATGRFGWLVMEVFVRRGKYYDRLKLPFCQRALTALEIKATLREAGFDQITVEPFNGRGSLRAAHRLFVAARP